MTTASGDAGAELTILGGKMPTLSSILAFSSGTRVDPIGLFIFISFRRHSLYHEKYCGSV